MRTKRRIVIGGLGALTPVILNLLFIDYNTVFSSVTPGACLGYAVRVLVLFYIGGFVAYLHKDENRPLRIFEFGIIAPALIMGFMNANNVTRGFPKSDDTHTVDSVLPKPAPAETEEDPFKGILGPGMGSGGGQGAGTLGRIKHPAKPLDGIRPAVYVPKDEKPKDGSSSLQEFLRGLTGTPQITEEINK